MRISRGESITDASARAMEMAVVRGSDEPEDDEPTTPGVVVEGVCASYEPGTWDTVHSAATGTHRAVRLCKTCLGVEEDHGEPVVSQRRTLIPPAPKPAPEAIADTPELAAARIAEAMGGLPGMAYYERLRGQVAERLGRAELTAWEELALRAYVSATAIDILKSVVGL